MDHQGTEGGSEKAGEKPGGPFRGKQGTKRLMLLDADDIPLGILAASANRHDSPLLGETVDTLEALRSMPERVRGGTSIAPWN
jgi:hypothetical protein